MAESVHKGHRQRLRDRASSEGLEEFEPHQIMELLLFYALPRQDTSEIAHLLIQKFGSVQGVFDAPREELTSVPGVGKRVADWLGCVGELVNAYAQLRSDDCARVRNYQDVFRFCEKMRKTVVPPATYHIALSNAGKVQVCSKLCDGLAWGEPMALKRGLNDVLASCAKNAIVLEFTGAQRAEIAQEDRLAADAYATVLHMMNVTLLDVIIVDEATEVSMQKEGKYDRSKFEGSDSMLLMHYLMEDDEDIMDFGSGLPLTDDGL